ncbi:MAG: hypothetical protein ACP5JO_04730 [Candidatus Ratteibacteria bacterium]
MKKSGLGRDPLSWITSTVPKEQRKKDEDGETIRTHIPKFQTFEIRLTVPFSQHHLEFLDRLQREILKNRDSSYKKERITKNSIIRACIDAFRETQINLKNIPDEQTLLERLKEKIKK